MQISNGVTLFLSRIAPLLCLLASLSPAFAAELIPASDFFRQPVFDAAVMSPSGKHVAATVKGSATGRHGLVVFDVNDLNNTKAVAIYRDADVTRIHWVNDQRLVFSVIDFQAPVGEQIGGGLFAVDREGKEPPRNLIRRRFASSESWGVVASSGSRLADAGLSVFHSLHSVLNDGGNDVVLARRDYDDRGYFRGTVLVRLDTVTGKLQIAPLTNLDFVWHWALDFRGNPRAAVSTLEGKSRLQWRATADSPWTASRAWDTFAESRDAPQPIAVDERNRLYVIARESKDSDITALMRIDMSAPMAEPQTLVVMPGFDFDGSLEIGAQGRLLGVNTLTDARSTQWLDASLKAIQVDIDKLLPTTINEMRCGLCINPEKVLVISWSDRQPPVTQLFDIKKKSFQVLGAARPWIKAAAMGRREMLRFTARDGMSIPVHVTHPANLKGPAPMVVLVHGGPYMRGGEWQWDANSQFLASRGYVVLEPEYRGSTGFGFKHFRAGWKQWGLAMQDDVADATTWAVKQGYADEKRICIAGASYGGYATMMGLVRFPDLYKCGVNWVGATDLDLLYTARWSDFNDLWREYGMPTLVGDREADAAQFAATSPIKQAARITRPVLMAYGDEDRRIPIVHGANLRSALEAHNKSVEWIVYKGEGHGWILESNKVDFWTRVEKFLGTHLKAP